MTASNHRQPWVDALEQCCRPVLTHLANGTLHQAMPAEVHPDVQEGRIVSITLEALGRMAAGIAPWLDVETLSGREAELQQEFRELIQQGLAHATNPSSSDYMGFPGYHQPLVDTAFLAQAMLRAPRTLWADLPQSTQCALIDLLNVSRPVRPGFTNWLLFSACVEAALCKTSSDWDQMRVDYALRQHEQWYVGDGHYGDGPQFHADYYNSFVIQPMMLDILEAVGDRAPFWRELTPTMRLRLSRYAEVQERYIHTDGTWPVLGRSICYRSGAFHALSTAAWKNLLPEQLNPCAVRSALTAVIHQTFQEVNFDDQGWLRIGLNGPQPNLGEHYISTGSLYLAAFIFPALGLPPDAPFWTGDDAPWTAVRVWQNGEDLHPDQALKDQKLL